MPDFDVVVIGGGHNGLVTAAYLARAGRRVVVFEARPIVGGTAGSERFAAASVNLCSCDHVTFRTTPVVDELELGRHGLHYLDVEPGSVTHAWSDPERPWTHWHDVEQTLDGLAQSHPREVDGYRRYVADAVPAARMVLEVATEPPTLRTLSRVAIRRRFAGLRTVFGWSRRSAADVLRGYFHHDALVGSGLIGGPMVWGVSPLAPNTGLGALGPALRHVGTLGRPRGGSGALPEALGAAVLAAGGEVRTGTPVAAILSGTTRVRGVRLADGSEVTADVVVSAADPRRTFVEWLESPPAAANDLVRRWRHKEPGDGFESKIDAVVSTAPRVRHSPHSLASTHSIAPTVTEMDEAARRLRDGTVIDRPAMLVNVPSLLDPSVAPEGKHVLSLEVLLTPYDHPGGWPASAEPQRWLELLAGWCDGDLLSTIDEFRVLTPDVYERDFHLPRGHATSFAGGPLAALRNDDPELTGYETAVPGLFLTGAATFPGAGIWGASGRNCATVVLATT